MKELWKKLICCHEWDLYYRMPVDVSDGTNYTRDTLICEKCGRIKRIVL